jgi:hypothetical protein
MKRKCDSDLSTDQIEFLVTPKMKKADVGTPVARLDRNTELKKWSKGLNADLDGI